MQTTKSAEEMLRDFFTEVAQKETAFMAQKLQVLEDELKKSREEIRQLKPTMVVTALHKNTTPQPTTTSEKIHKTAWRAPVIKTEMATPDTLLGKAQRMPRLLLLQSTRKAIQACKWNRLANVFVDLCAINAKDGGETGHDTQEKLFKDYTHVIHRKK